MKNAYKLCSLLLFVMLSGFTGKAQVTLSGHVWLDENRNGTMDGSESSAGVPPNLYVCLTDYQLFIFYDSVKVVNGDWAMTITGQPNDDLTGYRLVLTNDVHNYYRPSYMPINMFMTGEMIGNVTNEYSYTYPNNYDQTVILNYPGYKLDLLGSITLPTTATNYDISDLNFGMAFVPQSKGGYSQVLNWNRISNSNRTGTGHPIKFATTGTKTADTVDFTSLGNDWRIIARSNSTTAFARAQDTIKTSTNYAGLWLRNYSNASTNMKSYTFIPKFGRLNKPKFVMDEFDNGLGILGINTGYQEAAQIVGYNGADPVEPVVVYRTAWQRLHRVWENGVPTKMIDITATTSVDIQQDDSAGIDMVYFDQPIDSFVVRHYMARFVSPVTGEGIHIRNIEVATENDTIRVVVKKPAADSIIAIPNVITYGNPDSVNGHLAVCSGPNKNATLQQSGSWPTGISLDTNSGQVTVYPSSSVGTYYMTYSLTDTVAPAWGGQTVTAVVQVIIVNNTYTVGGTVVDDGNALTDNTISGPGKNGGSLYAALWDATIGAVVDTTSVNGSGAYSFTNVPEDENYSVIICQAAPKKGQKQMPPGVAPNGYALIGEVNGGTTSNPTGSDGTPDGVVSIGVLTGNVTQALFGIDSVPNTDAVTYQIPVPNQYDFIPLDGSLGNSAVMKGGDIEDDGQTSGVSLSGKNIAITQLPADGSLWYDDGGWSGLMPIWTGQDGMNPVSPTNPFIITGLIPANLQYYATDVSVTNATFSYAYIDAIGIIDPTPASFMINWGSPLPIRSIELNALASGCQVNLTWQVATGNEWTSFEAGYNTDGTDSYLPIGQISANSNTTLYQFGFRQPTSTGCYRIMGIDKSGKKSYSKVSCVHNASCASDMVHISPNPSTGVVRVSGAMPGAKLEVLNTLGKPVYSASAPANGTIELDLSQMPRGCYYLRVAGPGQEAVTRPVILR